MLGCEHTGRPLETRALKLQFRVHDTVTVHAPGRHLLVHRLIVVTSVLSSAAMARPATRRASTGRKQRPADLHTIPPTPGSAVPATPGETPVELESPSQTPRVKRNVASFYGAKMPRPALLAHPEQAVMQVVKSQQGRVEFVSAVQPLMGVFPLLTACDQKQPLRSRAANHAPVWKPVMIDVRHPKVCATMPSHLHQVA